MVCMTELALCTCLAACLSCASTEPHSDAAASPPLYLPISTPSLSSAHLSRKVSMLTSLLMTSDSTLAGSRRIALTMPRTRLRSSFPLISRCVAHSTCLYTRTAPYASICLITVNLTM